MLPKWLRNAVAGFARDYAGKDLFLTADFAAADGFDNNNISAAVNTTLAFINFNEGSVN